MNARLVNTPSTPVRLIALAYGTVAYVFSMSTLLYAMGFIGNIAVPKALDSGANEPWSTALAVDLGLLLLFGLQHSVMARQGFKRLITRVIPAGAERSTYVLASGLALTLLFWQWRPLGGVIWDARQPALRALLYAGFGCGWLLVVVSTFVINHLDLFGLRQSWMYFLGRPVPPLPFMMPTLYTIVRHPLYVGLLVAFWSTPTMTVTHLVFAAAASAYVLVAIQFEERDLMNAHREYAGYRARVPMLIPSPRPASTPGPARHSIGQ